MTTNVLLHARRDRAEPDRLVGTPLELLLAHATASLLILTEGTQWLEAHAFFACGSVEETLFWFPIFAESENWKPKKEKGPRCRRRKQFFEE